MFNEEDLKKVSKKAIVKQEPKEEIKPCGVDERLQKIFAKQEKKINWFDRGWKWVEVLHGKNTILKEDVNSELTLSDYEMMYGYASKKMSKSRPSQKRKRLIDEAGNIMELDAIRYEFSELKEVYEKLESYTLGSDIVTKILDSFEVNEYTLVVDANRFSTCHGGSEQVIFEIERTDSGQHIIRERQADLLPEEEEEEGWD